MSSRGDTKRSSSRTSTAHIPDDRFYSPDEKSKRDEARRGELLALRTELRAVPTSGRGVYESSGGPGTVHFRAKDLPKLRSDIEKELKKLQ